MPRMTTLSAGDRSHSRSDASSTSLTIDLLTKDVGVTSMPSGLLDQRLAMLVDQLGPGRA
jgi:hypothetical protein